MHPIVALEVERRGFLAVGKNKDHGLQRDTELTREFNHGEITSRGQIRIVFNVTKCFTSCFSTPLYQSANVASTSRVKLPLQAVTTD